MRRYKRIFSMLLVCALSAGLFVGCSKEKETAKAEREKVLLWHYWGQGHSIKELENLVEDFNKSQKEIEVVTQYVPDEDFKKRLALSMADNTMPGLALVDSSDFQYFHRMKAFVDLTEQIPDISDYLPQVKEACMVENRMMGLPYGMNCPVLYYNKNSIEQAGVEVPKTWDELFDTSVRLSKDGQYGFAISAIQSEASVYSFLPLLWSYAGEVDSLDSEGSQQAFRMLRELTEAGAMSKQTINLTEGDLVQQFAEGNIAMMINSTSMIDAVRDMNPYLKFGVTSLPGAEGGPQISVMGGEVFGVTEGPQKQQAIEFLQYISDKDRMIQYMKESSFMAPRQDVLETQYESDSLKQSLVSAVKSSRRREFSVEWPYISLVISDAMKQEIIGEEDESEILSSASKQVAEIRKGDL